VNDVTTDPQETEWHHMDWTDQAHLAQEHVACYSKHLETLGLVKCGEFGG
jgi:hypothetical protein